MDNMELKILKQYEVPRNFGLLGKETVFIEEALNDKRYVMMWTSITSLWLDTIVWLNTMSVVKNP